MNLSVIILTYNTKKVTLECVNSLIENYKEEIDKETIEIIVVDNASSDKTAEGFKDKKYVKFFESGENLGFSKGCNFGAKKAKGKYLLFLNSDTKVLDKGFIDMCDYLDKNKKAAILGGGLTNEDGSKQKAAGNFYNLINLFFVLLGFERLGLIRKYPKNISKVDWVGGACIMIRKEVFEKLKGFDEKIFMYMEDMEICFRAKQKGFLTYFYPNIKVIHSVHKSSNRSFAINHIYEGILHFYKKNKSYPEYLLAKIMLIFKALIALFIGIILGNEYLKKTYLSAIKIAI